MTSLSKAVFIVAAKRTPFGAFGGKLAGKTATDMQELCGKAAISEAGISPELIDSSIVGNVIQSSKDAAYIARHVALRLGVPIHAPALTVNRLCGSGFQSIVNGVHEILLDGKHVIFTGGTESMSQAPFAVRGTRFGTKLGGSYEFEDTLWQGLTDLHIKLPMGITAENLAKQYNISREDCDRYALQTQQRWAAAQKAGKLTAEISPVQLKGRKGVEEFAIDEHPKPDSTLEKLSKLPSVFDKAGTVSAANASGVCDGAGAVIIASEEAVKKHNMKPLARIAGYSYVGCDPKIMGIGPVHAIRNVLKATGKSLDQIDVYDVNEAFAPQFLAVQKELGLDPAKVNVCGGAIALGHPLAASGSRITGHLAHQIAAGHAKNAIGSACIGGGQGIAIMLEKS